MDKTAPPEQSRHCASCAAVAPDFGPEAGRLARLLTPALLDRLRDAIVVLGTDHRIWLWNKSAELLFGWSAGEVLGRRLDRLCPLEEKVFADARTMAYAQSELNGSVTLTRKDGGTAAAQACWTCVADEQGQPFAIVGILTEVVSGNTASGPRSGTVLAPGAQALLADLRQGLHDQDFVLHYQPQVDARGIPTGAEALVRWRHPQRGLVPPAEFIPLAEESGLILELDRWVLQAACTQLAAWARSAATAHLTLAVNMNACQFRHPDFVGYVLAVLERTGADPRRLKLEVTESSLIDDVEETIASMKMLKAHGLGFSLDDFGTGYSSLAYLKRLPLDQLKIDQSFVRDVLSDPNAATIALAVVTLGQSLGLAVIAEGVETEAQRGFLARHNCDAFQGYLFSPPIPADQFDAFIASRAADPAQAAAQGTDA
jgi:PAS domain S-box-containing protein